MDPVIFSAAFTLVWVLLNVPIYATAMLSLLPAFYWLYLHPNLYKKSYKLKSSLILPNGYQLHLRVNVLLHELYPLKDSTDARCLDRSLELSSQDFIQALRKMDLEDSLADNLEEANYLFQTNHLPLSSFAAVSTCSIKPEPSTSNATNESHYLADGPPSPNLNDDPWLGNNKDQQSTPTSFHPTLSPLCSPGLKTPSDSLESVVPSSFRVTPIEQSVPRTKPINYELEQGNHVVPTEINRSKVAIKPEDPSFVPSGSQMLLYTNDTTHQNPLLRQPQHSFDRRNPIDLNRSLSALTNSSSDSEVDYGTDGPQRRSITTPKHLRHRRNRFGSSSSTVSLLNITLEGDFASSSSSRDTFASPPLNREFDACSLASRSERRLRDAELLVRAGIPFSFDEVVHATNDRFRAMRASSHLTDYQTSVMLDVRKRAVNRLAAERCRRLKVATRDELAERLASIRLERQLLQRQVAQARQRKQKASDSLLAEQKRVLTMLRGPDGSPLKYTDWRVRLSKDDEVIVVAAGL